MLAMYIMVTVIEASSQCVFKEAGRYVGSGNGTPLQYSCLENPIDGGAW